MNRARLMAMKANLPRSVTTIVKAFLDASHECYLVGGAVRNLILGHHPSDFDFATDASPNEVMRLFRRVIPTGIQHGTVTVMQKDESFEITTYRTEGVYSDSRRPDNVQFVTDIFEDLRRRDFTMNSMAFDPVRMAFLDPHDGVGDIGRRVVRAIGDARERFGEDALRMLRAVRFAAQLDFSVDPATLQAIRDGAGRIEAVSLERVRDEINKLLESPSPSTGFRLLHETGLLAHVLPELEEGVGVTQRGNHRFDVFEHSIRACDAAPRDNLVVRLAAVLHDIGKPRTLSIGDDGGRRFHGHDHVSAEMAEALLRRLKYPNRTVADVVHLVRHHMFDYAPEWNDAAVRRLVARVGEDTMQNLIALREADSTAIRGSRIDARPLGAFAARVRDQIASNHALSLGDLAVNGNDLIAAGIPRGRAIGTVLEALLETVLDDPRQNDRDTLLAIALRYYDERLRSGD